MNARCKGDPFAETTKVFEPKRETSPSRHSWQPLNLANRVNFPRKRKIDDASRIQVSTDLSYPQPFISSTFNMVESVGPFYFKIQVSFKPFGCCRCPQRFRGPPKFNTPTEDAVLRSLFYYQLRRDVSLFLWLGRYIKCISVCVHINEYDMSNMSVICQYANIHIVCILCIIYCIYICLAKCSKIHQGHPIFPQFRTNHRLQKFVRTSPARFSGPVQAGPFFLHGRC